MFYITLSIVIIVLIIVIIVKICNRNYEKVDGKIVEFIEENGFHYPVFSFTTKDGKNITARNKDLKHRKNPLRELAVEDAFEPGYAQEFLDSTLPIMDVTILYNKDNPEDFNPQWI